jgi:hypothetical protein
VESLGLLEAEIRGTPWRVRVTVIPFRNKETRHANIFPAESPRFAPKASFSRIITHQSHCFVSDTPKLNVTRRSKRRGYCIQYCT